MMQPDRPTVRVKPNRYQPTRKELDEPVTTRRADGSSPAAEEIVRTLLRPVKMLRIQKRRSCGYGASRRLPPDMSSCLFLIICCEQNLAVLILDFHLKRKALNLVVR